MTHDTLYGKIPGKSWTPADDSEDMEWALQFHDSPKHGYVLLRALDANDCRRGAKPDCEDKHDLTKKAAREYIQDIADTMTRGGEVPPIVVDGPDKKGNYFLRDGHHRVTAAICAGLSYAPAIIIPD